MGVPKEWLRTDGKAGSVDLAILAAADESQRPRNIEFRTTNGLWYNLSPVKKTETHPGTQMLPDNTISPVYLKFEPAARITGSIFEETGLALSFMKNWALERRHFPRVGEVTLANAIIFENDRLTINGHTTSPVDVAAVVEYVEPDRGSMIFGSLPDQIIMRTFHNF